MYNITPRGYRAMVVSPHYLASTVGSSILQQGGNAIDAAVAVSAALAVVYPHMTGLGGDSFFLIYSAGENKVTGLNGSGRSAGQATPEWFAQRGIREIPTRGVKSAITVPGMVDAWWEVWSRYGKLSWKQLLAPAASYATHGFPVSNDLYHWMVKNESLLFEDPILKQRYFRGGELICEGERLIQPELAATLQLLMQDGRDGFYKGSLMTKMVQAIKEQGGLLAEDDYRLHSSEWVEPVSVSYRGAEVFQMPPNSQGFSLLMMLNMLEKEQLGRIDRSSAQFYHLVTEVIKCSFHYRDQYLTDPAFTDIPLQQLLSKSFGEKLHAGLPLNPERATLVQSSPMGQDTAYAAVMDEEGNAVSFIQSLYFDFGSAVTAGNTGIIMQNRGSFFSLQSDHPNCLAPHKRTFHTLMPGMVLRDGKPVLLMGTQGGEGQPQTSLSLVTAVLDYGCTIQEAIMLPRWVYGRTWGNDSDSLKLENRGLSTDEIDKLKEWGHRIEMLKPWDKVVGQAQGISIGPDGLMAGFADPRGDGSAIGW